MSHSFFVYRRTALLGAAMALILAACSEQTSAPTNRSIIPTAPSLSLSPEFNDPSGKGHIFHMKQWFASQAPDNALKLGFSSGTGIYYHGGSVLQAATNVVAVYWGAGIYKSQPSGTGAGSSDGSLVGYFLNNLGGSNYFNINTTYYNASGAHVLNIVNYTHYWTNTTNVPTGTQTVTDAQMISMLQSGFTSGAIVYDPNTLYAIFTAGKVNLGGGFGTQYCAYHTHGTVTINGVSQTVLYAAMPYDYAYPSGCTSGYAPANGSPDPGADYEVNTIAHETEETTTDMMGNAWYDRRGYENADKCAWTWGSTYKTSAGGTANMAIGAKNFLVQRNWVDAGSGGCAVSY